MIADSGVTSVSCVLRWHEFGTDYACRPDSELGNTILPAQLLIEIGNGTLRYPPPPPPPPYTASPPPPPSEPDDFRCYWEAVPQTTNTLEHIPCMLWCAAQIQTL